MADPTHPAEVENTQVTEHTDEGQEWSGEPAPPPPSVTPFSPITESATPPPTPVSITDRPTTTDPLLADTAKPASRRGPRKATTNSTTPTARNGSSAARMNDVRRWKPAAVDCQAKDLIDAFVQWWNKSGGRSNRRALNIVILGTVIAIIIAANWAVQGPTEPDTTPSPSATAETAMADATNSSTATTTETPPTVSEPSTSPSESTTSSASVTPAATSAPSAPANATPLSEPAVTVVDAPQTAAEMVPAVAETPTIAEPSTTAAIANATPPTSSSAPSTEATTTASPTSPATIAQAPTPEAAPVAATTAPVVATPNTPPGSPVKSSAVVRPTAKKEKIGSVVKVKPVPLRAIVEGTPYNSGGALDLDSEHARKRYQELNRLTANRTIISTRPGKANTPKIPSAIPVPPTKGNRNALIYLESEYQRSPASK